MSGLKDKTERLSVADFKRIAVRSANGSARIITGAPAISGPLKKDPQQPKQKKKHTPEERKALDKAAEISAAIRERRREVLSKVLNTEVIAEFRFDEVRCWKHDFYLPTFRIAIEIEGGVWKQNGGRHNRAKGFLSDVEKYNSATLAGIRVFRFTPDNVLEPESLRLLSKAIELTQPTELANKL